MSCARKMGLVRKHVTLFSLFRYGGNHSCMQWMYCKTCTNCTFLRAVCDCVCVHYVTYVTCVSPCESVQCRHVCVHESVFKKLPIPLGSLVPALMRKQQLSRLTWPAFPAALVVLGGGEAAATCPSDRTASNVCHH